jgi:hypothetical protein
MSLGALTEQGVIQIVSDNGGGYVKRITVSDPRGMPGQQLTIDTVLGTSPVRTAPPSGTVNSPDGVNPVECFTFTIGWQDTAVAPPARKDCPETALGSAPALANKEAMRVDSAADLASVLDVPAAPVPATGHDVLGRLAAARATALKAQHPAPASQARDMTTAGGWSANLRQHGMKPLAKPSPNCRYWQPWKPPPPSGCPGTRR